MVVYATALHMAPGGAAYLYHNSIKIWIHFLPFSVQIMFGLSISDSSWVIVASRRIPVGFRDDLKYYFRVRIGKPYTLALIGFRDLNNHFLR